MGVASCDSSSSSMSPVSSPSFVGFVDLYGKRRQVAKVQVLEREIGLLQDEIKSLGGLELASRCCKELHEYIDATPDPLIAVNQINGRSKNFWKNFGRKFSFVSWVCCFCIWCLPPNPKTRGSCCELAICHAKDCCCCRLTKTFSCNCPEISCLCSCNPSCPKCSFGCLWPKGCCSPCSGF